MTDQRRERMVETQIAARGIRDPALLDAFRTVPREAFVDEGFEEFAHEDGPLPIGEEQTISQPYVVALMIEAAELKPVHRVLEVGAGSGYAAAIMSKVADRIFAIERHASLVEQARQRFGKLGYDNIELRAGDGTKGWPEAAPFDAIIVSAGGPEVPESLKAQLALGGRLVIPLGKDARRQSLRKLVKTGASSFESEDLGAVAFVPLIGEQGWAEDGRRAATTHAPGKSRGRSLPEMIADAAEALPAFDDPAFGVMFDRFADRRVVLLGEASHGTSEFYRARAAITRRLVKAHGFEIVAVEADWPDAAAVDRHVRHLEARGAESPFKRFPTWMWRNTDVAEFVEWMRAHNANQVVEARAGFYGLDIYNMSGSIAAVLTYLDKVDPHAAKIARERYGCLTPWQEPSTYGRAVLTEG